MIRLLWVGITSNPIFGVLDAILKKYWGLLKTKYDEKCDNFGDFGGFIDFLSNPVNLTFGWQGKQCLIVYLGASESLHMDRRGGSVLRLYFV